MGKKYLLTVVVLAMVAGFAGGVMASWVLTSRLVFAQQTPEQAKVMQAERFEVVDEDGKVRVEIGVGRLRYGEPYLQLTGKDGKALVELGSDSLGDPFFNLGEQGRSSRIEMMVAGGPHLVLHEGDTWVGLHAFNGGANLDLSQKEDARIQLRISGETPKLELSKKRSGHITLGMGLSGYATDLLGVGEDAIEKPHLGLYGEDAQVTLTTAANGAAINLLDKNGKTRSTLGHTELKNQRTGSVEKRSTSSLVLFGEDGKVIWEAP